MRKTKVLGAEDRYLELIKRFPLRRLKSNAEHAAAVQTLTKSSLEYQGSRDVGVHDYLDTLAHLIDEYELSHRLKVDVSGRTAGEVVRHLIEANSLTISGLAREIGIGQSNLSEMLSGRREFSKTAIARICRRFGIDPSIFF